MIVAIDGPAGSGKSTVARALAAREGLTYLDTGAMYRAVTLACLERGVDPADADAVAEVAKAVRVSFAPGDGGAAPRVLLDIQDVTEAIRTAEVDRAVSAVSAVPAVREAMVAQQRRIAEGHDVVAEGRDIGTVVFPKAEVKVFLSADPEARAWRRAIEREGGDPTAPDAKVHDKKAYKRVLADIKSRDAQDSARDTSPLKPADDAVRLDSTKLTKDETLDAIAALVDQRRGRSGESRSSTVGRSGESQSSNPGQKALSEASGGNKGKTAKRPKKADEPMRAFHCDFDDYFDHGIDQWPLPSRAWHNFMCGVVYGFTKLYWPWVFEGGEEFMEELARRDKGTVIVQNHVSMVEPVITVVWGWRHGVHIRPVYKKEFEKSDLLTWVFSRTGAIPVNRGTADLKMARRCQRAIQRGESVLIYPEGTRIREDDKKAPIHGGFALIAQMARTDVTPMAVIGVRAVTPDNKLPARPHHVWFKVGRPISFGELGVKGRRQQLDAMEQRAMDRVWRLRAQLRAEHPGEW